MRLRLLYVVVATMGVAVVLLAPGTARSDTTSPFTGSFSPSGCGPAVDETVATGGDTVVVNVDADVPSNDIAVNLLHNGSLVANTDAGVGEEVLYYKTSEAGTYSVQVCPSPNPIGPFVSPYTYTGTFTETSAPVPIPPGSGGVGNGITPIPKYGSWNAKFAPATVIDAQRTEGEPLNFIDKNGNYWESGPWGTTTQNSFVHRSTDGGTTFHIVSPIGLRPDAGPGGGDTDIVTDDQGYAYFVDLEALVNLGTSVSNDNGNTWRKNPAAVENAAVDRQWYAVDNGTSPAAADNTIFLAFHETAVGTFIYSSPGSTGAADPVGGLIWQTASDAGPSPLASDAICAQLRFDTVKRNLYYACNEGDHVRVTAGHVAVGQRTGIAFKNYRLPATPGGGAVLNLFPALATDQAGNVYVAWIDKTNSNLYYSFSTDGGQTWSKPARVNAAPSNTNEFDWAQGGSAGTLALAWYGTDKTTPTGSDGMPNWADDPAGATAYPWYGYAALLTKANTARPTIQQSRFTEKPMHYGQICNSGISCTTTGGDRQMADFFGFKLDPSGGALRIVFNDTTNEFDGAGLFEARQIAGSTALGGTARGSGGGATGMADVSGDAQWPHYGPAGAGANLPQLDLTAVKLTKPSADVLRVQMSAASLASLLPPAGKTSSVWLTRFQALSPRPGGSEEVYRIFYVGAEATAGVTPQYFAGTATCQETTPGNCKIFQYPVQQTVTGSRLGNSFVIDVNLSSGFGSPVHGSTLYNVTAFTFGRSNSVDDLYADVDATGSFDFAK